MSEKGFGITFEYTVDTGSTWLPVGSIQDATPPAISKDTYETTHHGTPGGHKTFAGSLVDFGEASIVIQYDPDNAAHLALRTRAATANETAQMYQFTYADTGATVESFTAVCTGFESATPIDNKITATITFKLSGASTHA
jgi:hypothetical protein